eukprot:11157672-Alexandrium_andersonii.AAC.1
MLLQSCVCALLGLPITEHCVHDVIQQKVVGRAAEHMPPDASLFGPEGCPHASMLWARADQN